MSLLSHTPLFLYTLLYLILGLILSQHVSSVVDSTSSSATTSASSQPPPSLQSPPGYMDEIFHIPQTQQYCAGNWSSWDQKITTFPGMYVSAVGYAKVVGAISGAAANDTSATSACTPEILRTLNVVYGSLCIPLFYFILKKLHPQPTTTSSSSASSTTSFNPLLFTIQFSLFPLIFFFHFLYYTDTSSLFWILFTYGAHLHDRKLFATILSIICVSQRQTNIVWIGFMMLTKIVEQWERNDVRVFREKRNGTSGGSSSDSGEKEDKLREREIYTPSSWSAVPRSFGILILSCLRALPSLIISHLGHVLLCVSFIVFVIFNGGSIVIGDKSNHTMSLHLTQLLYFAAFSVGFTVFNWIGVQGVKDVVVKQVWRNKIASIVGVGIMVVVVRFYTSVVEDEQMEKVCSHQNQSLLTLASLCSSSHFFNRLSHPFLLSDNRHITFYIWKNILSRPSLRLLAIPVYMIAFVLMQQSWSGQAKKQKLWQVIYWFVVGLVLIPTPLIELRYFITPAVVWLMHCAPTLSRSVARTCGSIIFYGMINIVTLYLFLRKSFLWPDGSVARFMW